MQHWISLKSRVALIFHEIQLAPKLAICVQCPVTKTLKIFSCLLLLISECTHSNISWDLTPNSQSSLIHSLCTIHCGSYSGTRDTPQYDGVGNSHRTYRSNHRSTRGLILQAQNPDCPLRIAWNSIRRRRSELLDEGLKVDISFETHSFDGKRYSERTKDTPENKRWSKQWTGDVPYSRAGLESKCQSNIL